MKEPQSSVSIGFENMVVARRVIAIVNPNSAPIKRMIREARESKMLIDSTCGKPTRSVIVTDSGYLVLSSITPKKLGMRMEKNNRE